MDFNLKHWRDETSEEQQESASKIPKLVLNSQQALPLFVTETTCSNLSGTYSSDNITSTPPATKFQSIGSYLSLSQRQELELQALIFRHMLAGATVPQELLNLVKKSIINTSSSSPYYISHPLQHYYPHYQPPLLQSGYWGRGAMDPEPGRCRRTDGKKWRCSRDVVSGQKYCERHVHRGRNRSRKPVEGTTRATTTYGGDGGGGEVIKSSSNVASQGMAGADGGGGSGAPHFTLSGPSPSMDLLHMNRRPIIDTKSPLVAQDDGQPGNALTLRHFFDEWGQETDHGSNSVSSATNLSISLKLGTGNQDESGSTSQVARVEPDRPQSNWGANWEANHHVAPMGGPLAEALRSSVSNSNSSPTSVLYRLSRGSGSEATSFVSS